MRPCTASSCCCQVQSVSWAPVPTPHAAARPVICHGPLYRLPMLLPGPECVMGPCTASHCCCQARNLPWAPVPTPHAAARPSVSWVPVRPPIAAVSIATLCHVPLSGLLTLLVVSIFVIGCCMASHCCCLHRHTVAHTLVLAP
ncbi:unnamed protein product [Staurois parvus]|uniref:Uncharacterized protein n=1 Tax=Staurois parvus TaxID=386267 RepID=A0ABN9CY67_9NEOB|nr:unnamed protein product [Staurois parvus]